MKKNENKIKLIIFPGNFLPHTGGLESHVDNFTKYLSKNKKYQITIFTPDITCKAKTFETVHNNVKVIRYPAIEAVYNYPLAKFWTPKFWKLYLKLYKQSCDITMTRTMFFTNSSLGMFFAKIRLKKIKLIHVEHASDFSQLNSKFKSIINKIYMHTLGKMILLLSDKVVCISDASKQFIANNFIKNKKRLKAISIIRRGFDYDYVIKTKPNLKLKEEYKNKKIISFPGRLIDGKGLQDVIAIMHKLPKNTILLLMGDGGYRKHLEKQVQTLNLQERVIFLGKISYKNVIGYLKASDIFVNPSYTEGLPTNVLDGLFCQTKVLATDVGGTKEILGKYWKEDRYALVKKQNQTQIAKELNRLLKVKKQPNKKIIDMLQQKFNWENHAQDYDKIFEEVLNN